MARRARSAFAAAAKRNEPSMAAEQDPAQVSAETLQSFESDLPDPEQQVPSTPLRREGALILAGMAALIAVGVATALSWFF